MKGYLLCAGIVRLCYQEPHGVKNAMEMYEDVDLSFAGSLVTSYSGISRTRRRLVARRVHRRACRVRADEPAGPVEDARRLLLSAKKNLAKAVEEEEDDLT